MNRLDQTQRTPDASARPIWSVGIYTGASLQTLAPHPGARNPVLTRHEVTDIAVAVVADPFIVRDGAQWLMFIEVKNAETRHREIALARSSDGVAWSMIVWSCGSRFTFPIRMSSRPADGTT